MMTTENVLASGPRASAVGRDSSEEDAGVQRQVPVEHD
jgi:hypothetical protein